MRVWRRSSYMLHIKKINACDLVPQILARRQVQRDADKAADQAVDVAKGLEDERRRQEDLKREDAEATEKGKEALEAARVKAEAEKKRRKDLSKSPPHKR